MSVSAFTLYERGLLADAVQALGAEVRDEPGDAKRRIFLFELLCFAGEFERAEKHLGVLERAGPQAQMGALLYHAALHAERLRQDMFAREAFPLTLPPPAVSGTLNGERFESLTDADRRIGARLEVFAAGQYTWIPFAQIATLRAPKPARLRDLLWIPAELKTAASFRGEELGEVLVPAIAPLTWRDGDDELRLGRGAAMQHAEGAAPVPLGQKLLLVDGEPFPLIEVRELAIAPAVVS